MEEFEQTPAAEPPPLPTHAGPLPAPDDDFFAPLPAEIGEPLSVHTNWKQGNEIRTLKKRGMSALVVSGLIGIVMLVGLTLLTGSGQGNVLVVVGIAVIIVGTTIGSAAILLALLHGKNPLCTYVGTEGWSRHHINPLHPDRIKDEIILFADADTLHTRKKIHHSDGVYAGETYLYRWRGPANRDIGEIRGLHQMEGEAPAPEHPFWLAKAAEVAWSEHWLTRCRPEFESNGFYTFTISPIKSIRVGEGFMEFHRMGKIHRAEPQDIKKITFDDYNLEILFRDKEIMTRGRFFIDNKNLPNFHAFTIAMERHFGHTP